MLNHSAGDKRLYQETYELWQSEDGECDLFPQTNAKARQLLPTNARLLCMIDALPWEEAQRKKHNILGWEPYRPTTRRAGAIDATTASDEVTVCEDETYHPEICLVALEPVSNFILLEQ